ncbi:helix-turn-helix domain-containing protein [Streptomyces chartreusis]|uniref:helix-turn-helix domain-containing protein n=1 Tax=Streptomyces chartreusis TaxID=1969 RepID=UPI0033C5D349
MIAELVAEVGPLWHEQHQARLTARPRRRAVGAGAKNKFVFVDRLLATLVSLRHGTTHDVLACWFGVDRSTITRAIGEVRPLLAQRGCTVAPGLRHGPHGRERARDVLQPGPAGQLRRHYPGPSAGTGPAPDRRPVSGDPRGCRLSGHGSAVRRSGCDPASSQVQEERSRLVRAAARTQRNAHSTRHIRVEHGIAYLKRLAGSRPTPWPNT